MSGYTIINADDVKDYYLLFVYLQKLLGHTGMKVMSQLIYGQFLNNLGVQTTLKSIISGNHRTQLNNQNKLKLDVVSNYNDAGFFGAFAAGCNGFGSEFRV
jgi:hypothetical protein